MTVRDITRPFRRIGRRIKRVLKSKYGKLKTLIITVGLIAVVAAGILGTGVLKQPGPDSYQPVAKAVEPTRDVAKNEANVSNTETETAMTANVSDTAGTDSIASGIEESSKPLPSPPASDPSLQSSDQTAVEPDIEHTVTSSENAAEITMVEEQPVPASADWLEKRIQEHITEIQPQDLTDFRAIIAKLDQAYIEGLSMDGFTSEEQTDLKNHLHARLTEAEYSRAKELFSTYYYLMEEE